MRDTYAMRQMIVNSPLLFMIACGILATAQPAAAYDGNQQWIVELIGFAGRVDASKGPYSDYAVASKISNDWQSSLRDNDYRLTRVREIQSQTSPTQFGISNDHLKSAAEKILLLDSTAKNAKSVAGATGMSFPATGNVLGAYSNTAEIAYGNAKALQDGQTEFTKQATEEIFNKLDAVVEQMVNSNTDLLPPIGIQSNSSGAQVEIADTWSLNATLLDKVILEEKKRDHDDLSKVSDDPKAGESLSDAESIFALRTAEKSVRDAEAEVNSARASIEILTKSTETTEQTLESTRKELALMQNSVGEFDPCNSEAVAQRLKDYNSALAEYNEQLRHWRNSINFTCDTNLTFENCSCRMGTSGKNYQLKLIDRAQKKRDRTFKLYESSLSKFDEQRLSRITETRAKLDELEAKLDSSNQERLTMRDKLLQFDKNLGSKRDALFSRQSSSVVRQPSRIRPTPSLKQRSKSHSISLDVFPR